MWEYHQQNEELASKMGIQSAPQIKKCRSTVGNYAQVHPHASTLLGRWSVSTLL